MTTLLELNEKAQDVDIMEILDENFEKNEKEILEIYQQNQLLEGKDEDGGDIGYYQFFSYASEKNKMNPKPGLGKVDLKYTGTFFNEMAIQDVKEYYQIVSFVGYLPSITRKYGMKWAGFNEKVKAILIKQIILPKMQIKFKEKLGIG